MCVCVLNVFFRREMLGRVAPLAIQASPEPQGLVVSLVNPGSTAIVDPKAKLARQVMTDTLESK